MADADRAAGIVNCLQGGSFGRMAHIRNHAHAVHLGHHRAAHMGQAGIFGHIAARRQQGLIVIAQLHETQSKAVQHLGQPDIVFDATGIWAPKNIAVRRVDLAKFTSKAAKP